MSTERFAAYDVRVNYAGFFESYRDGVWRPPALFRDYDLLVFTSGTGTCLLNGKRHTVMPNDVLLMRRGDRIAEPVAAGRLTNMLAHFDFIDSAGEVIDPPARILPVRTPRVANNLVVASLTQSVIDAFQSGERASAAALLKAVLLLLAGKAEAKRRDLAGEHRTRLLHELAERILTDPAPHRTVGDLAAEVDMSPVQFNRQFRKSMGCSPGEFMVQARIERARLLLVTTSRKIGEISSSLGYRDEYYFSRQFAQKTGVPPATYRKQHFESPAE